MLQALFVYLTMDLVLSLAILAVAYYRRETLLSVVRYYSRRFLGLSDLERKMDYRTYKSKLHAKRLNSHLRRLNRLEGKPARAVVNNEEYDCDGRFDCDCPDCDYSDCMNDENYDNNDDSYAK